jgi:hypothetical protein
MAAARSAAPASEPGGPGAAGSSAQPLRRRRRWPLFLFLVLLLLAGAFALYVWSALSFSYSSGDRAGYVQKFSSKAWEGELAMVSLPGTLPEIFRFTVRDEAVAKRVTEGMGQRVALHYEQHRGVPTSCFGETEYFVTDVRRAAQ